MKAGREGGREERGERVASASGTKWRGGSGVGREGCAAGGGGAYREARP